MRSTTNVAAANGPQPAALFARSSSVCDPVARPVAEKVPVTGPVPPATAVPDPVAIAPLSTTYSRPVTAGSPVIPAVPVKVSDAEPLDRAGVTTRPVMLGPGLVATAEPVSRNVSAPPNGTMPVAAPVLLSSLVEASYTAYFSPAVVAAGTDTSRSSVSPAATFSAATPYGWLRVREETATTLWFVPRMPIACWTTPPFTTRSNALLPAVTGRFVVDGNVAPLTRWTRGL